MSGMYRNRSAVRSGNWEACPGFAFVSSSEATLRLRSTETVKGVTAGRAEQQAVIKTEFSDKFASRERVGEHTKQVERLQTLLAEHAAAVEECDGLAEMYGCVSNNDGATTAEQIDAAKARVASLAGQIRALQEGIADVREILKFEFGEWSKAFTAQQLEDSDRDGEQILQELLNVAAPLLTKLSDLSERRGVMLSNGILPRFEQVVPAVPAVKVDASSEPQTVVHMTPGARRGAMPALVG